MIASFIPILTVDVIGSVAMIIIALLSLYKAKLLRELDPDNAVFLYLIWISTGFTIFAVSRSFGHILRQFLILTGNPDVWHTISPYSGSVNTASFMLVGLVTLFFNQSWNINEKILSSRKKLETTHVKLMDLNQTLELKVIERTERLTSIEHKSRRIFEQSLDTILVTDSSFNMKEINPAGVDLTGYDRDEMLVEPMKFQDFFASSSEWSRIKKLIEQNEYILNEEADFLRPDKSTILVLITGGVDYGAFGCDKTYHFIIKNINDRRQMEQQIIQADKLAALGELSAGVAHEINNPLGIILGYTQLVLKEEPKHRGDLKIIEKHVKNCQAVVSDLLSFSRKGSTQKTNIDINTMVKNVIDFLSNHSDFRNVDINYHFNTDTYLSITGNEQEMGQVIMNLVINACHAVDGHGNITISTGTENELISITIEDNGKGIEKKDLSKIFDPFFTTKPVGQGTGLGLSVGYGIVKRHGGDIVVKSQPGKGTVFIITLPKVLPKTLS
ncbi:MAG: PAS domain S-box protein [Desulfobacteraceae bacterium]|nr:PAS domain S-box protein [Desulfobacteraceae bacterium]